MNKINKQQILFLFSVTIGILMLYASRMSQKLQTFTSKREVKVEKKNIQIKNLFPSKNYLKLGQLFRKVNTYKTLPSIKMPFPDWENSISNFLPPLPMPKMALPPKFFQETLDEFILPKEEDLITEKKDTKLSRLPRLLLKKVRKNDTILMNNSTTFSGKIINETNKNITIYVLTGKKSTNYTLPRKQIQKITRAISIEKICQNEANKFGSLSTIKRILQANTFAELKQDALAVKIFEKTIQESPKNDDVYCAFYEYWLQKLEYESAAKVIKNARNATNSKKVEQKYLELLALFGFQKNIISIIGTSQEEADVIKKIKIAIDNKEYKLALSHLNQISAQSEEFYYWQSYTLYLNNNFDAAIQASKKIANSKKWISKVANVVGCIHYLRGNLRKAQFEFLKSPHSEQSWYNLALIYYAANAKEEALKILKILQKQSLLTKVKCTLAFFEDTPNEELLNEALDETPNDFLVHYISGEIYKKRNEIDKAKSSYIRSMKLNFGFLPNFFRLAKIAHVQEKHDTSLIFLEQLLETQQFLLPDNVTEIYNSMAQILIHKEEEAKQYLRKSLQINAKNTRTLKLLAAVANRQGDHKKAISFLDKVLENSSQDAYAEKYKRDIFINTKSSYWEDTFSRKDSSNIRRGWFEKEDNGISIRLRNSQVFFTGEQKTDEETYLSRKEPLKKFLSISGEITTQARAYLGIFISDNRLSLYLGKDKHGKIGFALQKQKRTWEWKEQKSTTWPNTQIVRIEVRKLVDEKDTYALYVNEQFILKTEGKFRGDLKIGFFGKSDFGLPWSMHVDNVQIVELK